MGSMSKEEALDACRPLAGLIVSGFDRDGNVGNRFCRPGRLVGVVEDDGRWMARIESDGNRLIDPVASEPDMLFVADGEWINCIRVDIDTLKYEPPVGGDYVAKAIDDGVRRLKVRAQVGREKTVPIDPKVQALNHCLAFLSGHSWGSSSTKTQRECRDLIRMIMLSLNKEKADR